MEADGAAEQAVRCDVRSVDEPESPTECFLGVARGLHREATLEVRWGAFSVLHEGCTGRGGGGPLPGVEGRSRATPWRGGKQQSNQYPHLAPGLHGVAGLNGARRVAQVEEEAAEPAERRPAEERPPPRRDHSRASDELLSERRKCAGIALQWLRLAALS